MDPALSCTSSWSGGNQSFSLPSVLEGTGGRRGGPCRSLAVVDCCQSPVYLRKWFSKSLLGFYRDLFPYRFPALGMEAVWISTDLFLQRVKAVQSLGD